MTETWQLGRRPALDGVRGVAVLLVIWSHLELAGDWSAAGGIGVCVFFVLSGFLITTLIADEVDESGRLSFRGFYARRARRLLPALAGLLFVLVAVAAATGLWWIAQPRAVLATVFYLGNVAAVVMSLGTLRHMWSLAVEEQFYAVWPLVLVACLRHGGRVRAARVAAVAAGVFAAACGVLLVAGVPLVARIAGGFAAIMLGAVVALWMRNQPAMVVGRPWVAWAALVAVVVGSVDGPARPYVAPVAGLAAGVAFIYVAARTAHIGWLTSGWLRYVGRRSYALYLWHYPILAIFLHWVDGPWHPVWAAALVGVSFVVAEGSWRLLEAPALRGVRRSTGSRNHPTNPGMWRVEPQHRPTTH